MKTFLLFSGSGPLLVLSSHNSVEDREFLKKLDEFTVNIALVVDNTPVLGVIFAPARDELYHATQAGGTYLEKAGKKSSIKISERDKFCDQILVGSRSHASDKLKTIISDLGFAGHKVSGSSLKGCLVAMGGADVYLRLGPLHEWDVCAMNCILSEAGGKMTDLAGESIKYNNEDTLIKGFLASNGLSHEKILEKVKEYD